MNLAEVAKVTQGKLLGENAKVRGFSIDTRSLQRDEAFIALKGPNFDGHDFVAAAKSAGACAALVQKNLENVNLPQVVVADTYEAMRMLAHHARANFTGKVAALTGSCGKTTVRGMLQAICHQAGGCIATRGNLNNLIGVPLSLLRLNNEVGFGIFEAGTSVPGEIPRLAELIDADVALVNNVMASHVEGFGSVENIALEKTELFVALKPEGVAVINLDDAQKDYFISRSQHCKRIGFTTRSAKAEQGDVDKVVTAGDIRINDMGSPIFDLCLDGKKERCQLTVLGEHNITNALAAAATSTALDVGVKDIVAGLQAYRGEARRMQLRKTEGGAMLVDDSYNASPGSFKAAIDYLKRFDDTVLVMGDMGELGPEEVQHHRDIGLYARSAGIESLYATGILAAETANAFGAGALWCESQSELIEALKARENTRAVILVKGSRFMHMDKVADALCQREGEN